MKITFFTYFFFLLSPVQFPSLGHICYTCGWTSKAKSLEISCSCCIIVAYAEHCSNTVKFWYFIEQVHSVQRH